MGDFEMYASGKCHIRTCYNKCTFSFCLSLYKFHLWRKIGAQQKNSPEFYILFTVIDCVACVFLSKLHVHLSLETRFRSHCLSQSMNVGFHFHTLSVSHSDHYCGILFSMTQGGENQVSVNANAGDLLGSDWSPHGLHFLWCIEVPNSLHV